MDYKSSRSTRVDISTPNSYADIMIERIQEMIAANNDKNIKIDSGIVESINSDGTVNVYFPPEDNKIFTKISNQTPYQLVVGDNVEILVKNGSYSNCWVIAKHSNMDWVGTVPIKDYNEKVQEIEQLTKLCENL